MQGLIDQRQPSLELALRLLEGVRAEAEARSLALAMCVVDAGGHAIATQRMDGAALGANTVEQAQRERERRPMLVEEIHQTPTLLSTNRRPSSAATTTVNDTSSTTTATAITCGSWVGNRSAEYR